MSTREKEEPSMIFRVFVIVTGSLVEPDLGRQNAHTQKNWLILALLGSEARTKMYD